MFYDLEDKKVKNLGDNWSASNASIIGDVTLEKNTSIWFNVTLRGDVENIHIGEGSNSTRWQCIAYRSRLPIKNWKRCNYWSFSYASWLHD